MNPGTNQQMGEDDNTPANDNSSERLKILQMLSDGKVTPEQAESLLNAVERDGPKRAFRGLDKPSLNDLKSLGAQISATVTQSLSEAKRALEGQLDVFSLSNPSVSVTHELSLPLNTQRLTAQTTNGAVQVTRWDEPYVRIHIRARAKTNNMSDAKRALTAALQIEENEDKYQLTVVHGDRDKDNGVQIAGAHLDIYVPKLFKGLFLRSQNGKLSADGISCDDLHLETTNGSVSLYQSTAERVVIHAENGGIELVECLSERTRNLHAQTKNGSVSIERLPDNVKLLGRARTSLGRIQVTDARIDVSFDDDVKRSTARFQSNAAAVQSDNEVRVHLETRNGSIRIKP